VTRESEKQPFDQRLHAFGGALHPQQAIGSDFVEFVGALHLQAVAERADFSQRLLKIVGSDVGELLQLVVRPLELGRIPRLLLLGLLPAADVANEEGEHRGALLVADGHRHFGRRTYRHWREPL